MLGLTKYSIPWSFQCIAKVLKRGINTKKSYTTLVAKNKEALPKTLAKTELPNQVIQLASNSNDIKEYCSLTVVNQIYDTSENHILQKRYNEKFAYLQMQRDYANIVVGSKAEEMASLITKRNKAEKQMMIVST